MWSLDVSQPYWPSEPITGITFTCTYLHCNVSTTNPDLILASIDIAALASKRIIDGPECGYRMMIKATKFPNKPRTFSN
jgi:hypothetical protein